MIEEESVVCECTDIGFRLDDDPDSLYYGMWVHICGKPKALYLERWTPEHAQYR